MTIDEAVKLVVTQTGDYPVSAFEFDGAFYVLMTPFKDYDSDNDTTHCYYPVVDGRVQAPVNDLGLFLAAEDPYAMSEAAEYAKSYLGGIQNGQ